MIDFHIKLPKSDWTWLREQAFMRHLSMAEVVRELIRAAKGPGEQKVMEGELCKNANPGS